MFLLETGTRVPKVREPGMQATYVAIMPAAMRLLKRAYLVEHKGAHSSHSIDGT